MHASFECLNSCFKNNSSLTTQPYLKLNRDVLSIELGHADWLNVFFRTVQSYSFDVWYFALSSGLESATKNDQSCACVNNCYNISSLTTKIKSSLLQVSALGLLALLLKHTSGMISIKQCFTCISH